MEIKQLKNKIQLLNDQLRAIEQDKAILIASLTEYQKKFGSLISINVREEELKKYSASDRDIMAIEMSQESKNAVMAEVLTNHDDERLMRIVEVLMRDTNTMDDTERTYWKKILPTINFEQRFRFLDILATERIKLAELERTFLVEIKKLNEMQLKKLAETLAKQCSGQIQIPIRGFICHRTLRELVKHFQTVN